MNKPRSALILICSAAVLAANVRLSPMRRALHGRLESVRREDLTLGVLCAGTLEARNVDLVQAAVSARVSKKYVEEGSAVKKGQLLLELDTEAFQSALATALANLNAAERDHSRAARQVPIQQQLFEYGAVPKKSVEDAQASLERARAALEAAQKTVSEKRKNIESARIASPRTGYIIKDWLKKAAAVTADKEIFTVGTLDVFWANLALDEIDISKVAVGQDIELKVQAFPDAAIHGKVRAISPQAERTSYAKISVAADLFDIQNLPLKPNLTVDARIVTGKLKNVLTVPTRAVVWSTGKASVWVLGRLGRTALRSVALGQGNEERVEVRSGLTADELVLLP